MSTLLFMALALTMAVCIARYNKSNSLFWVMAISLMGTFAITSAIVDSTYKRESKEDVTTQFKSTQGSTTSSSIMLYVTDDVAMTSSGTSLKPVGKIDAEHNNIFFTPSEYYGSTLEQPPQKKRLK